MARLWSSRIQAFTLEDARFARESLETPCSFLFFLLFFLLSLYRLSCFLARLTFSHFLFYWPNQNGGWGLGLGFLFIWSCLNFQTKSMPINCTPCLLLFIAHTSLFLGLVKMQYKILSHVSCFPR